ncbi:RsbR, positive regulator of sigma-B [Labilithrix luteola]|uniref:RsbR, positive regulator of sigma-B n=1 Tax=Labilithrix luteola TaxID=1391654 RepID=A0A0K1QG04_9BACT|nr:STAS domain-containing protein [Labilithrix luteola]AKV04694.1 RsbR, positive regulator of sigma-B [Labilithrix luteola]
MSAWGQLIGEMPDPVLVTDERGNVRFASESFLALAASTGSTGSTGSALSALEGKAKDELLAAVDSARESGVAFQVRALGSAETSERPCTLQRVDGTLVSLVERARRVSVDGEALVLSTFRDVSAHRAMEVEIAELRKRVDAMDHHGATVSLFARVLDSAPLVLLGIDREGTITLADGRALTLLGLSADSVGENLLHKVKSRSLGRAIQDAFEGKELRGAFEVAPGVFLEAWLTPLKRRRTGEVTGALVFGVDATERVKGERELRENMALVEKQSATIRSLAMPLINVWDDVVCVPLIGALDDARASDVLYGLLTSIVRNKYRYVILDLTGVEEVDVPAANHLISIVDSVRMLGAESIVSGMRAPVAQTVAALDVDISRLNSTRSLKEALKICIRRTDSG